MQMNHAIILILSALGIAAFVDLLWPAAGKYLPTRVGWAATAAGAMVLSAASWFVTEERMGGTVLQLRHGWPKFYSLECIALECPWDWSFEWVHFLGNSFFYGAGLVLAWTLVAIMLALFRGGRGTGLSDQ